MDFYSFLVKAFLDFVNVFFLKLTCFSVFTGSSTSVMYVVHLGAKISRLSEESVVLLVECTDVYRIFCVTSQVVIFAFAIRTNKS